ncbi:hypothetical protein CEE37_00830 [candidate division LCP-89 bacterium B3_LCP]|uniref:DUF3096 domain-containing protein n=1 Tax=candidate division LCP-89 bacterium B3_LCP TaxID=2012998 RepID=A0A532V4X4_UNCL8|nr:MAG: hypothetical protein CEE37_00830 [candidate division LCP-89 bacterium B3_LCP]
MEEYYGRNMKNESIPAYQRPTFWIGSLLIIFGMLLWAYPELLSFLVGAFFIGLGIILLGRILFPRRRWDKW